MLRTAPITLALLVAFAAPAFAAGPKGDAAAGAEKARAMAADTLADVREAMGVGPARRVASRG